MKASIATCLTLFLLASRCLSAQEPTEPDNLGRTNVVLFVQGLVQVLRHNSSDWIPAQAGMVLAPGDQIRTTARSRAELRLSNLSVMPIGPGTIITFQHSSGEKDRSIFNLQRGQIYYYGREEPGGVRFRTPLSSGAMRGTEFALEVADDGATTIAMFDGTVELESGKDRVVLGPGEGAKAGPDNPLIKIPAISAHNKIQWVLYYPAVLDPNELAFTSSQKSLWESSLSAYRTGDLTAALAQLREPASNPERIYTSAVLLSVGAIAEAQSLLNDVAANNPSSEEQRLATALAVLIDAVQSPTMAKASTPENPLTTELLAHSYREQSQSQLENALALARAATERSPQFGFAWSRYAELQFSFGNHEKALAAVERALTLSPRNAEALALRGFLYAAQSKAAEALESFNEALRLNGALPKSWLGRGLVRIRQRDSAAGLADLQTAASLEPHRALFRSYLGKGYQHLGDSRRSADEFILAKQLDKNDPTSWLFAALLHQQENRINQAIRHLEVSQKLNDNRSLFRSRFLLDQDQGTRSANLANIYRDAGMLEVSRREAYQAVHHDYANFSAHLFLANSYGELSGAGTTNRRFETQAVNEYLLANLLAPPNAGLISSTVSENEYSRLFGTMGLGFSSITGYSSNGDWAQAAAQYGTFDTWSYSLDLNYQSSNGQRPNEQFEQWQTSAQIKQQLTPADTLYLQAVDVQFESGDLNQYYDPASARKGYEAEEDHEPILLAGYHHEWQPGSHSIALFSWVRNQFQVTDPTASVLLLTKNPAGRISVPPLSMSSPREYRSDSELYSGEFQQIWQSDEHTFIGGARFQQGEFETQSQFETSKIRSELERGSLYAYHFWQVRQPLQLIAGLAYDQLRWPRNFRNPPISEAETKTSRLSPKAAVLWDLWHGGTLRASYTRSLGGVSFDQSFRLEPTQIAGFAQGHRSLISESLAGALAASDFQTWGVALDQKFETGTYIGLEAQWLLSDSSQTAGAIDITAFPANRPTSVKQTLDFREQNIQATVHQLVANRWVIGGAYRVSQAELATRFPDIPPAFGGMSDEEAILHQVILSTVFNHESGLFARGESIWWQQSNRGYTADIPGDDFWQFNAFCGYRFPQRRAEVQVGILNITDQDFRLNPLNFYLEPPRERMFVARVEFHF